jgi:hypothetical protein
MRMMSSIKPAPYEDVIPFLSEHVQPSDQLLFVGLDTDMAMQMSRNGYGTTSTGFLTVISSDESKIAEAKAMVEKDDVLSGNMKEGRLSFKLADYSNMADICQQSVFDSIVDYGGIDSLHTKSKDSVLKCIDHLQDAVRLGNILVCLSQMEKDAFCGPFEERWGWVQELDGDPGEISAWYRGKSNIAATTSNFQNHGLKMYVYTNTDNC